MSIVFMMDTTKDDVPLEQRVLPIVRESFSANEAPILCGVLISRVDNYVYLIVQNSGEWDLGDVTLAAGFPIINDLIVGLPYIHYMRRDADTVVFRPLLETESVYGIYQQQQGNT